MRSVLILVAAFSSAATPSTPNTQTDEVATPTEQAATAPAIPQQHTVIPARAAVFPATCKAIADDIEKIARQYPQLATYRAADQQPCAIRYSYRTHAPKTRGGWSASVPQPDADGVWLYIGIYDPPSPEANSQVHTQPVVPNWWIGSRKVMFLILESAQTTHVAGELMRILERHGLVTR